MRNVNWYLVIGLIILALGIGIGGYFLLKRSSSDSIPPPQDRVVLNMDPQIISQKQADMNCSPSAVAMGDSWDHHGYRERFDTSLRAGKIPVWNAWFSSAGEISSLSKPGWWLDAKNHRRYITQRDVMLKLLTKEHYFRCISLRSQFFTPRNVLIQIPDQLS